MEQTTSPVATVYRPGESTNTPNSLPPREEGAPPVWADVMLPGDIDHVNLTTMEDDIRRTVLVCGEWEGDFIHPAHFVMPLDDGPTDQNDAMGRWWGTERPPIGTASIPYVKEYMKHQPAHEWEEHGSVRQRDLQSLLQRGHMPINNLPDPG